MRFISNEPKLDFSDVLLVPKTSTMESRSNVNIQRTFQLKHTNKSWTGIPIIAANMDTTGTIKMVGEFIKHNMLTALHKHYSIKEIYPLLGLNTFYSMGTSNEDLSKLDGLIKEYEKSESRIGPEMICIDVANGYTTKFIDVVKMVREKIPQTIIMAGNVVTPEKTEQIILAGADIVKIGVGGGSVCTTRKLTGVGYPQLSAVIECADAAHGLSGLICSDGGCVESGDIVKAIAAGADFVMIGGMLAGTDECGGDLIYPPSTISDEIKMENNTYKFDSTFTKPSHMKFYGMSSKTANDLYSGGLDNYRAAEGKEVLVPYKGPVNDVIQEILGGLRSAMTYIGATELKELTKRASFVLVNHQRNHVFDDK